MADDVRAARAEGKADKARAKAMRPWFKKKRFIIPLVLVAIIIIASVASSGSKDKKVATDAGGSGTTAAATAGKLYPGRPDVKKKDVERNIGEGAQVSGYTATVVKAAFQQQLTQFEKNGYMVADVTLLNRDSKAQSYNTFNWKLITPQGTIIDPCLCGKQLGSGDLVNGGNISGQLIWEVGAQKGDFYIIFDPPGIDEARGIWKATA
jgi:hypothetical protein